MLSSCSTVSRLRDEETSAPNFCICAFCCARSLSCTRRRSAGDTYVRSVALLRDELLLSRSNRGDVAVAIATARAVDGSYADGAWRRKTCQPQETPPDW